MPDLFQAVESFFSGVVGFFYNILSISWLLLTHPVRGPRLLNIRYLSNRTRQVGPTTFLFSLTLLMYIVLSLPLELSSNRWLNNAGQKIYEALSGKGAMAVFVAAVTGTIIVDITIKAVIFLTRRGKRKAIYVQRYGYIVSLAGIATSIMISLYLLALLAVVAVTDDLVVMFIVLIALAFISYFILMVWLYIGSRATGIRSRFLRGLLCFLTPFLLVGALIASTLSANFYGRLVNAGGLELKSLICTRKPDKGLDVTYVLTNHDSETLIVRPLENRICLFIDRRTECTNYKSFEEAGLDTAESRPLQVIDSGKTAEFRSNLRQIDASPPPPGQHKFNHCIVQIKAATADAESGSSTKVREYTPDMSSRLR